LNFPPHSVWQVYDLPKWTEEGRRLAEEHGEKQLQFTRNWQDASGVDLLLVSGSLHFFDPPVSHMIAELPEKPAHVLINRTPLINGPTKATVQDKCNVRTARILYNRGELIAAFEMIGYELIDTLEGLNSRLIPTPGSISGLSRKASAAKVPARVLLPSAL
jgi:putative methyltransferase (TIGR04325 family)